MAQTNKDKFREQVKNARKKRIDKQRQSKIRKESKRLMEGLGYQIKATTKGLTLNTKDSPYLKPKKVDKRRTAKQPVKEVTLSEINISSDMKVPEIRKFIRQAVSLINKTANEVDVDYRVQQSYEYIGNMYGTYRDKLTTLSKAKKDELLRYARVLKSHMVIDDYTSYGQEKVDKKMKKAYITYMDNNHVNNLTLSEFGSVSKMFSKLSSSLIEKYGSDNLIELWEAQQGNELIVTPQSFAEIAIDVFNKHKKEGLDDEDMAELFREELKNTFDDFFRNGG